MRRLLFAFPVIAALAITPSSALASGHHGGGGHGGGHHGGGGHGFAHHAGGGRGFAHHAGGGHGFAHHGGGGHGGGYHHPHHPHYPHHPHHPHHPHWNPYGGGVDSDGSGYQGSYEQSEIVGGGVDSDGSGYQGSYEQPGFVQPPPQAYQIPPGYEGYPDGTVINYGGYNYVISDGVMYPAG